MNKKSMTKNEKVMLKTLRWLARFNLGDMYEERIQKTLTAVGACPHRFSGYSDRLRKWDGSKPEQCVYCNLTRAEIKKTKVNS
jgi:hypothetical protein